MTLGNSSLNVTSATSRLSCVPLHGASSGATSHSTDGHLACLLGVKIQIQSLNGEHLHIREFHRVKVGDIATGISSQVRGQGHTYLEAESQKSVYLAQPSGRKACE